MTRFFLAIVAFVMAIPALVAAPVPADGIKNTTFPYPSKAPVVVCLNGYDKARNRLSEMLKAALPDDATTIIKLFDTQLNKMLEGRKLTALRKDARAFLVVNDLGGLVEGNVPVSVLVPVTSYKEFRETFLSKDEAKSFEKGRDGADSIKTNATGEEVTLYLVDLKEYVAATTDKGVADTYAAKYTAGSTEPMGPELAESFLKADIAVYVNMDAINEQFGDKIRGVKPLIDFGLQQAQQQGALPGLDKKQLEAMKVVFKGLFQGIEDCRAIVVGAEFLPEGLSFRLQARFAENTPSAKLIQSETASSLKEMGRLPKGLSVYTESRLGDTLTSLMKELSQEFSPAEDDEKSAAKIEQALKDRLAAGPRGEANGTKQPSTTIIVSSYKQPAKAVEAISKAYQAVGTGGKIGSVMVKSAPKVTEKGQQHRSILLNEIKIQFDFEGTVAALPEAIREATLESLKRVSSEKQTLWVGTDGKNVIQITAKDWTDAKAMLDQYLDGKDLVGSDPAFAATRNKLPADATVVVIAETASTLSSIYDSMKMGLQSFPGAPQLGDLKAAKGAPTYLGLAFSLKGDVAGLSVYVPTGSMATIRKMVDGLLKNIE